MTDRGVVAVGTVVRSSGEDVAADRDVCVGYTLRQCSSAGRRQCFEISLTLIAALIRGVSSAESTQLRRARAVTTVVLVRVAHDADTRVVGRESGPIGTIDIVLVELERPVASGQVRSGAIRLVGSNVILRRRVFQAGILADHLWRSRIGRGVYRRSTTITPLCVVDSL